jgi:hypothetical protein
MARVLSNRKNQTNISHRFAILILVSHHLLFSKTIAIKPYGTSLLLSNAILQVPFKLGQPDFFYSLSAKRTTPHSHKNGFKAAPAMSNVSDGETSQMQRRVFIIASR